MEAAVSRSDAGCGAILTSKVPVACVDMDPSFWNLVGMRAVEVKTMGTRRAARRRESPRVALLADRGERDDRFFVGMVAPGVGIRFGGELGKAV
jgi:hypothetical protein